jgi:hypothetical protein
MNGGASAALKSEETFLANIHAGDKHALMLEEILKKTRFSVGAVNASINHRSIKFANFVKCVKMGETAFLRAATIIDTSWPTGSIDDNLLSGMTRLFVVPEYEDLMDTTKAVGRDFQTWIQNHANNGVTQKDLSFVKYRNAGPWYDSGAYGLARHFFKHQRSKNKVAMNLKYIKDVWESHAKDGDSDSGIF